MTPLGYSGGCQLRSRQPWFCGESTNMTSCGEICGPAICVQLIDICFMSMVQLPKTYGLQIN